MSRNSLFPYIIAAALCLTAAHFSAPYAAAQNDAAKKTAPAQKPVTAKKGSGAVAVKKSKRSPEDPARLTEELEFFAKDCIVRMNRQRRPGISHKEVKRQPDGSYMARYMAVDPDSLELSYDPITGNKTVKYIGRMQYHEVEYTSSGTSQKQALAGPFNEANRVPVTELIKYKQGKWCY